MNTNALPGLDDLDDVTLHEPVTKENDMSEARERADLVEAYRLGFVRAAEWSGRDDLRHDTDSPAYIFDRDADLRKLGRAELSRASATALEPVEHLRHIVAFVGLAARSTPFMPVGKVMDDAMRNVPEPEYKSIQPAERG